MAEYSFTAFKWGGYNKPYSESVELTIEDDDDFYEGGADSSETASIDGGTSGETLASSYNITIGFNDPSGVADSGDFKFIYLEGDGWYFVPEPGSSFTEGAQLGSYQCHTSNPWKYKDIVCFCKGTRISTIDGLVAVEDLIAGQKIQTYDNGLQTLKYVLHRQITGSELAENAKLYPITITAGAMGNGLPMTDLSVSRQHRMLISSVIAKRMFANTTVLISAIKLTSLPGIYIDTEIKAVDYYHLVFDSHQIIFAENSPTESFHFGVQALSTLSPETFAELCDLFPLLGTSDLIPETAYFAPPDRLQKQLLHRHIKNNKPLFYENRSA